MRVKCDRMLAGVCVAVLLLVGAESAQADTLHGNAAETQAAEAMRDRLKSALATWDLAACRREGANLARYNQAAAGRDMINADIAAVDTRIRQLRDIYASFRQVQTLNASKAVDASYRLIRCIAAKMVEDAATDLTLTLVTAPLPGVGKVISGFGIAANDFLGNFSDSGKVIDRAKALRSFDAMARYANEQMKSLIPAIREAEKMRASLAECDKEFQAGAASVNTPVSIAAKPGPKPPEPHKPPELPTDPRKPPELPPDPPKPPEPPTDSLSSAQWVLVKTEDSGPTAGGDRPLLATVKENTLGIAEQWNASISMYQAPQTIPYDSRHVVNYTFSRAGLSGHSGDWHFRFNDISWDGGGMGPRWEDSDLFMMTGKMSWQVSKAGDGMTGKLVCLYDYGYTDKITYSTSDRQGSSFTRTFTYELRNGNGIENTGTLNIVLTCSDTVLMPGRVCDVKAKVSGGKPPYTIAWSGPHSGSDALVHFSQPKPGTYTLTASATDAAGKKASKSILLTVESLGLKVRMAVVNGNKAILGIPVRFVADMVQGQSAAKEVLEYQWQPHPEAEFTPYHGPSTKTTVVFRRPGTTLVWATALQARDGGLRTVAEADQVEIEVVPPHFKMVFLPPNPLLGQEVKARIVVTPEVPGKYIDFRWLPLPANARLLSESQDTREITFALLNESPVEVEVLARTPHFGDDLGRMAKKITGTPYKVTVPPPRLRGPAPQVFRQGQGLVDAPRGVTVHQTVSFRAEISPTPPNQPLTYLWTSSSDACLIHNTASQAPNVTCSEAGVYRLTVVVKDARGVKIGTGLGVLAVVPSPDGSNADKAAKALWFGL